MAKAFWCVRAAVLVDGEYEPSFPESFSGDYVAIGDLRVFGPDPAPADHKHSAMGCLAIASNHGHWVFFDEGVVTQEFFGGGVSHNHDIPVVATHLAVFVMCSDAAYAALLAELPNLIILAHCTVTQQGNRYVIGLVERPAWDGATRTAWENKFDNFGIGLPVIVTNDYRLIMYVLTAFLSPAQEVRDEPAWRPQWFVL